MPVAAETSDPSAASETKFSFEDVVALVAEHAVMTRVAGQDVVTRRRRRTTLLACVADDRVVAGRADHALHAGDEVVRRRSDRDRAVGAAEHDRVRARVGAEIDQVTEEAAA